MDPQTPYSPVPHHVPPPAPEPGERGRYRPPIGIPVSRGRRIGGLALSITMHVLVILLLIVPFTSPELIREVMGAGGAGPAGGGGGGNRGTGGQPKSERLTYVRVAPTVTPPVLPPLVKPPEVKPIVPPPIVPPPTPQPKPEVTPASAAVAPDVKSAALGAGGGAGTDGSVGAGPGSGGGIGSGVGTGRGSAVGPGTGGGPGTIYPPAPIELFLPPMPIPGKAKGEVVVQFDVDSTGKVLDIQFTPTKDGNYNRKLGEAFRSVRFRPATNGLGVPVRAKYEVVYSL